jgi:predicted  nucleic acid-binding Zn-ribbon protein
MTNGSNGNQTNGDTPQPDRMDTLESFVEALDISIENLESRADSSEDEIAQLKQRVTELEKQAYGDEDEWKKMSIT